MLFDEVVDDNTAGCKSFTFATINEIIDKTKVIARNTVNKIKTARYQVTANRLNAKGVQASKDIFNYVKDRCRNPSAAIYDPVGKKYVFDQQSYIFKVNNPEP